MSRIQELKRNLSLSLQESAWDDALAVLGKLVEMEGTQPAYHNQIGDILLKSGRQSEALDSFMRGVQAYRELEMFPNGAALCKKILRLDPEQRDAMWFLGELKTRQGFLSDGAEKMLDGLRAFAEDPDYPRDDLLGKLDSAESLQAGNREALEFVATSYARMNEAERARGTTLRIAELEEREGNSDKARELRTHAQELYPQDETASDAVTEEVEAEAEPPAEIEVADEIVSEPEVDLEPVSVEQPETEFEITEQTELETEAPVLEVPVEETIEEPEASSEAKAELEAIEPVLLHVEEEAEDSGTLDSPIASLDVTDLGSASGQEDEVELMEITVPEPAVSEPELLEFTSPNGIEQEIEDPEPETLRAEENVESEDEGEEGLESLEFVIPEDTEFDFDSMLNVEPAASEEAAEVISEIDEGPLESTEDLVHAEEVENVEDVEETEDANALAESMLELIGGDDGGLPEVEFLNDDSSVQDDLLTTRQVVETLSDDLADGSGIELIHEDGETEVLSIGEPCPEAEDKTDRVARFADLMNTDHAADWPLDDSWPADPGSASSDTPPVDAEKDVAMELHSLGDSLLEAEGDWSATAPEEESKPIRDADKQHEIHFDPGGDDEPISFGMTTTAGEALQTDDVGEVLGEFRRRMKEQMGSMAPEERYQLGVSYMEMGLHAEALDEFEHTLEHKVLGAKTREWMARCLLELERPREIVLLLQTKLDAETYPHKSMVELYYVLGQAYEMLKAWDLALDAYTKVYQLDGEFRGVQEKLALLTNAE